MATDRHSAGLGTTGSQLPSPPFPPIHRYAALRRVDAAASALATLLLRHVSSEAEHRALLCPVAAIEHTLKAIRRLTPHASAAAPAAAPSPAEAAAPAADPADPSPAGPAASAPPTKKGKGASKVGKGKVDKGKVSFAAKGAAAAASAGAPANAADTAVAAAAGADAAMEPGAAATGEDDIAVMGAEESAEGDGFDSFQAQADLRASIMDEAAQFGLGDSLPVDRTTLEAQRAMELLRGAHCTPCDGSAGAAPGSPGAAPPLPTPASSAAAADGAADGAAGTREDAAATGGGPLQRHAVAALSALLMGQLCGGATAGEPPQPRTAAELAVLERLVPTIIGLLRQPPVAAVHDPMLVAALWGLARRREMRGALVGAGAVECLLRGVADLCATAEAKGGRAHGAVVADEAHGSAADRAALFNWSVYGLP